MRARSRLITLSLRYPFGLSRSTDTRLPTVLFRLGDCGLGEAPPVRYLGQDPASAPPLLQAMAAGVDAHNLEDLELHAARGRELAPAHSSARSAFDIALWDAAARRRGLPLHAHLTALGLAPPLQSDSHDAADGDHDERARTTYTIALDSLAAMETRATTAAAAGLPLLKIKLGRDPSFDVEAVRRIRAAAPDATLRVDVNGGWAVPLADALALCRALAELGVELIEQPLPIGAIEQTARLRRASPVPIIADEDAQDRRSLAALREHDAVDGINLKLSKCGGVSEALAMISVARAQGWRILLGCMVETRVGLSAAAQLAALVDDFDLDAHMLTTDDPVAPGSVPPARWSARLPRLDGPGIGAPLDLL
ncbi:MAG: dipeptide epimerase [Myxococcales bacterium]|nr:dipeptide epimerase [Myxococcales bacterium]